MKEAKLTSVLKKFYVTFEPGRRRDITFPKMMLIALNMNRPGFLGDPFV
ncbi:Unknown protein sequence [Pseudomonas amygdali pv. morsprunorum]|nr:Unknown protein sequence [Pseudomonas amygdali pv. morsprunorum]